MRRILSCSAVFGMFDQQETQTVLNLCSSAYLTMDIGGIVSVQDTRLFIPVCPVNKRLKQSKEIRRNYFLQTGQLSTIQRGDAIINLLDKSRLSPSKINLCPHASFALAVM